MKPTVKKKTELTMSRTDAALVRNPKWWKEAVVYQIYPRSFCDGNGDGIGDLPGIVSKLDYLAGLGVDVIWLSPIFASPNDDNGYDISDYRDIMKDFGTMSDFDRLLEGVHEKGMKLVLDLVVNHTSDEHPWFVEARKSRTNPYYGYYHWWPAEKGTPPSRRSHFDENGDAWMYNPATDSYYLHYFSRKQPDLNWENPEVRSQVHDIMRFWLDKGIDGFRMDSIPYISKDISFPVIDEKKFPGQFGFYSLGPHLHEYLHEMNTEVLSRYDCMSVGEGSNMTTREVWKFVDPSRHELDMLYHFGPSVIRGETRPDSRDTGIGYSLVALKKMFTEWDAAVRKGWPTVYLGNHDQPRMVSRFASDSPGYRDLSAKMLAAFLLTMRGTPYWYAGDEIGMANIRFDRIEDYDDIDTHNKYKYLEKHGGDTRAFLEQQKETARDNSRTPFQWTDGPQAGFTTGKPWLKVNPDYRVVNAGAQNHDPRSVLNWFRRLVSLRKSALGLVYGKYTLLDASNRKVFAYTREGAGQKFLIVLNFSPKRARVRTGMNLCGAEVLMDNYGDRDKPVKGSSLELRPFEAVIYKIVS